MGLVVLAAGPLLSSVEGDPALCLKMLWLKTSRGAVD